MQTSKIKPGEIYAMKRGDSLVRFHVTEIVTRRSTDDRAKNEIMGYVVEDRIAGGGREIEFKVDPEHLLGPFAEHEELRVKAEQEEAARQAKKAAADKQARADRIALYWFVGAEVPKNPGEYHQLFRASYGTVDISSDGKRELIARIHELRLREPMAPSLRVVNKE